MSINRRTFLKWVTTGVVSVIGGIGLSKAEAHHKSWHRARPPDIEPTPTPLETPFPTQQPGVINLTDLFTIGTLVLTKTYNNIGVYLPYTNDDNANATFLCEFKKSTDSVWREALPLQRIGGTPADTLGRAITGSILFCDPNTEYNVRITITDTDGVTGTNPVTGTITTRADAIPAASSLSPTRYVDGVLGNDSHDGTVEVFTSGTTGPWKTLDKALTSTPSEGVVQFAPGFYYLVSFDRSSPITLKSKYPAITNSPVHGQNLTVETDTSKITFFDLGNLTAPTGSPADAGYSVAPWNSESFTGPVLGGSHTGWYNWTNGLTAGISHLMYANSRDSLVWTRVPVWDIKSGTQNCTNHAAHATPFSFNSNEAAVETIEVNGSYIDGGTFQNSTVTHTKIPGNINPNDKWCIGGYMPPGGNDFGIRLTGLTVENVRITGICLRMLPIIGGWGASGLIVDHNLFISSGIEMRADNSTHPDTKAANITVEYNVFRDNGLWDESGNGFPWNWMKMAFKLHDGSSTSWSRIGAFHESGVAGGLNGGATQFVLRRNYIDGYFNGFGAFNPINANMALGSDRFATQDNEAYNNYFTKISDDCFEPEQVGMNWRIYDNIADSTLVFLSTGPLAYGPIYVVRNRIYRTCANGVAFDVSGGRDASALVSKFSGSANPPSTIFMLHNTGWSDEIGSEGSGQYAGGGGNGERFYLRNNIFRMAGYAFQAPVVPRLDEDYNHFASTGSSETMNYNSGNQISVAAYRTASGQGAHSNEWGGVVKEFTDEAFVDALLTDPINGDLTLKTGTNQFVGAGVVVPNVSDVLYVSGAIRPYHYIGDAPDIGYFERDLSEVSVIERTSDSSRLAATSRTAR